MCVEGNLRVQSSADPVESTRVRMLLTDELVIDLVKQWGPVMGRTRPTLASEACPSWLTGESAPTVDENARSNGTAKD